MTKDVGSADMEKQSLLQNGSAAPAGKLVKKVEGISATTTFILYYAFCSSLMLVVNKVAIHKVPAPAFVLLTQLAFSAGVVLGADKAGLVVADDLEWEKVSKFLWAIVGFLGTIFANIKVLQNANVETFITFRSSTPLVLSICDYYFLGRALPSRRSWMCLLVLLGGSLGYVMVDADFKVSAYFWLVIWYFFFTFEAVYVKHMCDTVKMTNWGRVYYTNLLSLLPLMMLMPSLGEQHILEKIEWDMPAILTLCLACALGVGMSHAGYLLRESVSATLFTIVGILCKVLTVIINILIWDKHASPSGVGFLLICVLAGTFYEQAPMRNPKRAHGHQEEEVQIVASSAGPK